MISFLFLYKFSDDKVKKVFFNSLTGATYMGDQCDFQGYAFRFSDDVVKITCGLDGHTGDKK